MPQFSLIVAERVVKQRILQLIRKTGVRGDAVRGTVVAGG